MTTEGVQDTYESDDFMSEIIISVGHSVESPEDRRAREHAKKERQVTRWVRDTIPGLVQPYMRLLRESQSLRSVQRYAAVLCTCESDAARSLRVTCVYFDRESLSGQLAFI